MAASDSCGRQTAKAMEEISQLDLYTGSNQGLMAPPGIKP